MITLQETTSNIPLNMRHTYIVDDSKDKVIAYIKNGSSVVHEFSKPLRFSMKERTFSEVKQ